MENKLFNNIISFIIYIITKFYSWTFVVYSYRIMI